MPRKKKNEVVEEVAHEYLTRGNFSDDISRTMENIKTPDEVEFENYKRLCTYEANGEILWGTVVGSRQAKDRVLISVIWNGIKITIPDSEYFEDNYTFGKTYDVLTPFEKARRRQNIISYQNNAITCFCVKGVSRDLIEDPKFDNKYLITAVGSRKEALEKLKDMYFFHKGRKTKIGEPINLKKGDIVETHVMSVKEDMVLVECFGVEVKMDCFTLSNEYIDDCRKFIKPGDIKKFYVSYIKIDGENITLRLTGRTSATPKEIKTMEAKSIYFGTVISYHKEKNSYRIYLKNGVTAFVLANNVEGNFELIPGDNVLVYVTKIHDDYVFGNAKKC